METTNTVFFTLHKKPHFLFPNVLRRSSFQKNCTGIWSFLYYQERWYFFFPKISCYSSDGKWKMIFPKKIYGNMIFYSNVLERWSFQKNRTAIWSLLSYYLERLYFFFPKIWSYSLDAKWKMIFLKKKKYIEKWYFLEMPWKDGLSKKNGAWIWSFLYYLERLGFFFQKIYFSLDGKWKMIFFKKYMEVWYFLCICKNVTNMIFSRKIYLKVIDILDRILERVPIILCTFMETFRRFDILLSSEKNPGNLIYRI